MHNMRNKKKKKQAEIKSERKNEDSVIFMTAYDINKYKYHIPRFWIKTEVYNLIKKYHIEGIVKDGVYATKDRKYKYTPIYDTYKRMCKVEIDKTNEDEFYKTNTFHEMMMALEFFYSAKPLLDETLLNITMCYNLERFLVLIDETIYQIDPIAYMMNGSLIVIFEMINYNTAVPLSRDDIYGRDNNFNIKKIDALKYFGESDFVEDNRKISDIIFDNVYGFMNALIKNKWEVDDYSFIHNILVISNELEDVHEYYHNVIGVQQFDEKANNLSSTEIFGYYSYEGLGVVRSDTNDKKNITVDCILLEAFKIYVLLEMIKDYNINHKLNKVVDHQTYVGSLFFQSRIPIITINVINNIREMILFKHYKEAVEFKRESLRIWQERRRYNNSVLLNIMLYILAMMGSFQTIHILHEEFCFSFKLGCGFVSLVFLIFGVIWVIKELINK